MSALTDLFTALANKIRSKTGGSDTYTPPEMVAAIDDVYDAGVAAGTKPTQTKSAGPNVSTNKDVTPDSGYLLSKVTITPLSHTGTYTPAANTAANDLGEHHDKRYVNTSGMIIPSGNKSITANGTGIDVSSYATASVNVPNPTLSGDAATGDVLNGKIFYNNTYTKQTGTMTNQGAWTSTGNTANATTTKNVTIPAGYHNGSGYVQLASLASQTGVDSGKTAIDASHVLSGYQGWVNGSKVSGTYSAQSGGFTTTTLWTNSSPTSSFAGQSISWSGNYGTNDFDFIEIKYRYSTSNSTSTSVYMTKEDFANTGGTSSGTMRCNLGCYDGNNNYGRGVACGLGFLVSFGSCYKLTTSSANTINTMLIPTAIIGHNFKP